MAKVIKKENESLEQMLKKFKKKVQDDGILQELKKREYFISKGEKRRREKAACIAKYRAE